MDALKNSLFSNSDWRERRRAVFTLLHEKPEGAFELLETALGDRDPDVRHAAVISLGKLGDPRAVELLCRPLILEDPSVNIRWAAVTALGEVGSLTATHNALSRALEDTEWVVRNQALLVMSDFLRSVPETIEGEEFRSLIRLLAIPDDEVRGLVVDALARRSTRGLNDMVEALHGKSIKVRSGVAQALGQSRDPRAVVPLINATGDTAGVVRAAAAEGLENMEDKRAVEPLIVVLGDSYLPAGQAAVNSLVKLGAVAVEPLCRALDYSLSKLHRKMIIKTLGGIRNRRAVLPLMNCLSSTYFMVRQAAIEALASYGESVVDDLISMVKVSMMPVDFLVKEVKEERNKRLRLRAIRALGEVKNAAAIKPLREVVKEPDEVLRQTTQEALSKIGLAAWARHGAVVALGNIGHYKAVPALINALTDYSEHVRGQACQALAKVGDPAAVPPLLQRLAEDEFDNVRWQAAKALRALDDHSPTVAYAFRTALKDFAWRVRMVAARALGRREDRLSVEALLEALDDSSHSVRNSSVHALANLGDLALPHLLAAAAGKDTQRRPLVMRVLGMYLGEDFHKPVDALTCAPPERRASMTEELKIAVRRRNTPNVE